MVEKLLRELIQEGLMIEAEDKLRDIVLHIDWIRNRLTAVRNLSGIKVEDFDANTELFIAREKLGFIIKTLSKEGLTDKQRILFNDALELVESAEKHIRWIREELGCQEQCAVETDTLIVITMLRNMKYI